MNDTVTSLMKGLRSVTGATLFQAALTLLVCIVALRLLMKLLDRLLSKSSLDPQVRRYLLTGAPSAPWASPWPLRTFWATWPAVL